MGDFVKSAKGPKMNGSAQTDAGNLIPMINPGNTVIGNDIDEFIIIRGRWEVLNRKVLIGYLMEYMDELPDDEQYLGNKWTICQWYYW